MGDRCTGHCCRSFPLSCSFEDLSTDPSRFADGEYILDMIIPTGEHYDGPVNAGPLYTCRHLDPSSGDCREYDHRPALCREHPYKSPCYSDGCTWEAVACVSSDAVSLAARRAADAL